MKQWLEFEARSRAWLRGVAQASAWLAPYVVLSRRWWLAELTPARARAPAVATVLGLLLIVVLLVMVRRGRMLRRRLFLPAFLPVLVGSGLAFVMTTPLGETFGSQVAALTADDQLRRGLVVDGFRGGFLLLSVALTVVPWLKDQPPESGALPIAFGLRLAAAVLAIGVMLSWGKVDGVGQACVLLPVLLGIVALAEVASAPGRESALLLGVAVAAALLGALAVPIDEGKLLDQSAGELTRMALKGVVRYLPALLLAFGLVFARRVDPRKTPSSLLVALAPVLLAFTLGFGFMERAGDWMRAPGVHWLRGLPEGFQLAENQSFQGNLLDKERVERVLVVAERSLTRGGQDLGPTTELDTAAGCDRLVQRLALPPGESLLLAADRRVPFARLDCLLTAVARSARARRAMLDAEALKALCSVQQIRSGPVRVPVELYGEGCLTRAGGLAVHGRDWVSAAGATMIGRILIDDLPQFSCPPLDAGAPGVPGSVPVALTRRVPDLQGHRMLGCGYATRLPQEAAAAPSPPLPKPPGPDERLLISGEILAKGADKNDVAFSEALQRCHSATTLWPQHAVSAWLAVSSAEAERPEIWHVASSLEHEAAARCVRDFASEFNAKLRSAAGASDSAVRATFFYYSLEPQKLHITLTTEGGGWYPQEVESRLPAIKACYEPSVRANPQLDGTLKFTLSLGTRHRILAASSRQPPAMDRVAYCIAPLFQGLDTKPPPDKSDVRSASFNIEMKWLPR